MVISKTMMTQTSALQSTIETVEALTDEEQVILFEVISRHPIERRRQEILENAQATKLAVQNGTAKRGNAMEVMALIENEYSLPHDREGSTEQILRRDT